VADSRTFWNQVCRELEIFPYKIYGKFSGNRECRRKKVKQERVRKRK